jgi:erythromycin esterase-like protein
MRQAIGKVLASIALALGTCSCASIAETPPASTTATTGSAQSASLATRDGLVAGLRAAALPITGKDNDYDALMKQVGDARVVMLGESTHGTAEFYRERMHITQRLIRDKGLQRGCY